MRIKSSQRTRKTFVSLSQSEGKFEINGELFEGIGGTFLGIADHTFSFRGKDTRKLDLFLREEDGTILQVQVGFYSWLTLRLMNMLQSVPNLLGKEMKMFANKDEMGNFRIFVLLDGTYLKHKYSWDTLKLKGLDAQAKEARRNKIIDTWYEKLASQYLYFEKEEEQDENAPDATPDEEDVPF